MTAVLVLEDGRIFRGEPYGALGQGLGEAVFTTGMTGYQETLTDPSYHRQVVVQTAPQIGNTGWNDEDDESGRDPGGGLRGARPGPHAVELALHRVASTSELRAAGRSSASAGVDTRALTRHLRERGRDARPACSPVTRWPPTRLLVERVRQSPPMVGADLYGAGHHPRALRRARGSASTGSGGRAGPRDQVERRRGCWPRAGIETHVLPASTTIDGDRWRSSRTGSSSPTGPATRPPPTCRSALHPRPCWRRGSRCSASASATRSSAGRWASAPTSCGYGHRGINQPVRRPGHRPGRDHRRTTTASPSTRRWTSGGTEHRFGRRRGHPRLPERQRGRGPAGAGRARVQRAVPPRGGGRPARRRLPLRPVRRAHREKR